MSPQTTSEALVTEAHFALDSNNPALLIASSNNYLVGNNNPLADPLRELNNRIMPPASLPQTEHLTSSPLTINTTDGWKLTFISTVEPLYKALRFNVSVKDVILPLSKVTELIRTNGSLSEILNKLNETKTAATTVLDKENVSGKKVFSDKIPREQLTQLVAAIESAIPSVQISIDESPVDVKPPKDRRGRVPLGGGKRKTRKNARRKPVKSLVRS
jgi:hypothetical protein